MEKGEKDINQILDMPLTFMMDELYSQNKKKKFKNNKSGSMLEAFGASNPEGH